MKNTDNAKDKKSTLTVTLLNKIERIRRIVTVITVVPKEAWVPFGFNCWQSSLPSSEEIFITGNSFLFCIVKIKITFVTLITSFTNLATLKLDTYSSVQTLIDFTGTLLTFRFVIASMRSMVFKCLDNFLCFSLSSRTSHYENTVLFQCGATANSVSICKFNPRQHTVLQQYVPRNTVANDQNRWTWLPSLKRDEFCS